MGKEAVSCWEKKNNFKQKKDLADRHSKAILLQDKKNVCTLEITSNEGFIIITIS